LGEAVKIEGREGRFVWYGTRAEVKEFWLQVSGFVGVMPLVGLMAKDKGWIETPALQVRSLMPVEKGSKAVHFHGKDGAPHFAIVPCVVFSGIGIEGLI